jgi:hypothetical protein
MTGMIWARKCWSARGKSGHKNAGPFKGMFYPSSIGTLTFVRMIETCIESDSATERVRYMIPGHFFCFGEGS